MKTDLKAKTEGVANASLGSEGAASDFHIEQAARAANFGIWTFEGEALRFECDRRGTELLGLTEKTSEQRQAALRRIDFCPETFLKQEESDAPLEDGAIYRAWSFVTETGVKRYLATRALVSRDDQGRVSRISGVVWDETVAKESASQVLEKKKELETLLYVISHDLREPLRAIRSYSSLLQDRHGDSLDEQATEFVDRIRQGGERMSRLLDDVLNLSRIYQMNTEREQVPARGLVESALESLNHRIAETKAKIVVADDLPELRVNPVYAKQALTHLIGNALKFTRSGEAPELEIAPYGAGGDRVAGLVFKDRGPGIPEDRVERVFTLFQRGVGRDVEGTGAGLAIVRQIARKHGGELWHEPRESGGSQFTVTFAK
ncbi:ATP-binding protein [Pelagicoccus sp. SDUM812003]|uniref:sensor histidine kinase n=1 Tax=Pelagicoccus sp. SDUM812003 TaxID=3041267 RepID=UPI00280CE2B2|nr:ATP-binding protein [Pelagicoccus sp. SDUM812003]MDQ8204174.1 ATP-binding protein [Pelagicoccus sp. SDUM812003]